MGTAVVDDAAVAALGVAWAPQRRAGIARRLWRSRLLGVVVALAVIGLLAWRDNLATGLRVLPHESRWALAAVVALNIPCTLLRGWRSQRVLHHLGARIGLVRSSAVQLIGQTLSWVTPGAVGDLVRPMYWREGDGIPLSVGVVAVAFERVASLALLAATGLGLLDRFVGAGAWLAVVAGSVAAVAVCIWGAAAATRLLPARVRSRERLTGVLAVLQRLRRGGEERGTPLRLCVDFTAATLAVFILSALQVVLLAAGLGGHVWLLAALAVYGLSQAAGSLSGLPFGFGPTDAVTIALLAGAGLDVATATAVAVLLRCAVTLPVALAGWGADLQIRLRRRLAG